MKTKISKYFIFILISFFTLLYAGWSVNRHNQYKTDAVDLGIFDQPIWHWSRFEPPLSTIKYNQFPGANLLGDHFHPILILTAPLFWLWDDVRILLILQSLIIAIAAYPIYKIAEKILGNRFLSLGVAFAYLTFIGIQAAVDYDFHETALAVLPLSLALYALVFRRDRLFWFSFIIGLFFKEDMPLYFAVVGVLAGIRFRHYRRALLVILISVIYYYLVTQKIIPYFKGDRFAYEQLPPQLGKTTLDLIKITVFSPWVTVLTVIYPVLKLKTLLNYFASFGFLSFFDPLSLILIFPNLVTRFLTELPQRWIIRFQYGAVLAPLIAFGSIYGINFLRNTAAKLLAWIKITQRQTAINIRDVLDGLILAILVLAPLIQSYRVGTPLFRMFDPAVYRDSENNRINQDLLGRIPSNASVMAQSAFVPHLTHRPEIYRYEDTLLAQTQPEYILMSLNEHSDPPYTREQLEERVAKLRQDPRYTALFWDGTRLLMRKR